MVFRDHLKRSEEAAMRLLAAMWARIIGYYGFGDRAGFRRREPVQIGYGADRRRA